MHNVLTDLICCTATALIQALPCSETLSMAFMLMAHNCQWLLPKREFKDGLLCMEGQEVYCNAVVCGQLDATVCRRVKDATGTQTKDVAVLTMVKRYNEFMGGVDKSDLFMSYDCVLCQRIRYWMTLLYHLIAVMAMNAFIFYNWIRMKCCQDQAWKHPSSGAWKVCLLSVYEVK